MIDAERYCLSMCGILRKTLYVLNVEILINGMNDIWKLNVHHVIRGIGYLKQIDGLGYRSPMTRTAPGDVPLSGDGIVKKDLDRITLTISIN